MEDQEVQVEMEPPTTTKTKIHISALNKVVQGFKQITNAVEFENRHYSVALYDSGDPLPTVRGQKKSESGKLEEGEVIDSMPSSAAAAEFGYKGAEYPPRTKGTLFGLSIITFLVIATGIMVLVVVYQHSTETFSDPNKIFESYCVVPFLGDYRVMMEDVGDRLTGIPRDVQPIQFHLVEPFALESAPTNNTEDEVRRASLKEKFDVYLQVVYINVYDNGRVVTIVQDFEQRITGIVDKDRCFVTEMEDEFVLPPELLVVSAKRHADFDVTRLHRSLQAALPALPDPNLYPRLYNKCFHKPMYYLQKLKDNIILRKREIGYPMLDYVYFAGKHVLELEILNLDDVIYSEQVYEHK